MDNQEKLKNWVETLKKFNDALIELFELSGTELLNEAYLQTAVKMLVDILQVKYGALALLNESSHIADFIHVGVTTEEAKRIGHLPEGKGLLGIVIKENKTLNLEDISKDPKSCGFPPHHPRMKSLLAAPVSCKDLVYGRVYLSDKKNGEPFTKNDEKLLSGFAHLLGLMIRNKNDSERIALLNKELVTVSRQAGMAEVSISVLHNMGNTLNSLNVSAQVLQEKIQDIKVSKLNILNELLKTHSNDLGPFFTENQKGQHVIDYLRLFSEQLNNEKTALLNELKTINNNIEHMKNAISLYQSMDEKFSIIEPILIGKALEAVLSPYKEALAKYLVVVKINNTITAPITLDRLKLEQILTNLIANALDALSCCKNSKKQLTLSAYPEKDHMISIQITDNGIGISAKDLTHIFNFGFTTKAEKHGFSLHTNALAAQEMGGTLLASSEGPDKGATFTLTLPINKEKIG